MKLHEYLNCDPSKREFYCSITLEGTDVTELPDDLVIYGSLDLDNCQLAVFPRNLSVQYNLFISNPIYKKLADGLIVGKSMMISDAKDLEFPDHLSVNERIVLTNSTVLNYPVIYNCGALLRSIHIDIVHEDLICIGCYKGTRDQAIMEVKHLYKCSPDTSAEYIDQINQCFKLWETIKLARAQRKAA